MTLIFVHALGGRRRAVAVLLALGAFGCGRTITEEPPTAPLPTTSGPLTPVNPIPAAPAPQPTPRPNPTPTPPDGGPPPPSNPPPSGSCGSPTPPPIGRMQVGIHIVGAGRLILDSTPLVGPDRTYCQQIGFTDGRQFCPVRPEGHPERFACESGLIGQARDTGRIGPTWTANGAPCLSGGGNPPYCNNHPENQFLVFAYGAGTFTACAQSGVCGAVVVQ